jgi:hypothetical protein
VDMNDTARRQAEQQAAEQQATEPESPPFFS